MKKKTSNEITTTTVTPVLTRLNSILAAAFLGLLLVPSSALADKNRNTINHYNQINLVSDLPGMALVTDTNLVNAWGISFGAATPFWVSANGTGLSTIYTVKYDTNGAPLVTKAGLEVGIPGEGNPTGQIFDGTGAFHGDIFIFASEDGTISGWRPALGTAAETLSTRSGAIYKGITQIITVNGPMLLAANFHEGTLDAYDTNLTLVAQFKDTHAPAHYAPFNVQTISGHVFVTFAKQDADKHDDVGGRGHGLIDIFNPVNGKFTRFASGSDAGGKLKEINSPWGLALAPDTFGKHARQLLVGNFGSGTIMAFEGDGDFQGLLKATNDGAVVIDGLWGLTFGNGTSAGRPETLYFSAGPGDEGHGLFGSLDPVKRGHGHGHGDGDDDDDD